MNNYPIQPQDKLFGWCSSCDKLVMTSQLDLEQVEAAEGAECPTCGDYLITKENEQMEKLIERVTELEAKLAALEWQPITADNLPKVGDEVLCKWRRTTKRGEKHWSVATVNPKQSSENTLVQWSYGFTHFRAINPPEAAHE